MSRTGYFRVAALVLCLFAGCNRASTAGSADPCAPPPPWVEANAKPGQPAMELAACLRDQAYQTRNLAIPIVSVANGIIAQCEIRVDRFEGAIVTDNAFAPQEQRQAAEQDAMQQATDAINQYRRCVGR